MQSNVQKMWTAFHANDAPAFAEQISLIKDTSFLSNSPNPVPCQAAKKGQLDILKEVLRVDSWACVAVDPDFRSPVHLAAMNGSLEMLQSLFESKPARVKPAMLLKQTDNFKMTPLHCAVLSGNEDVVMYLIDYGEGAGADVQSKDGQYPIQMAVSKGMLAAVSRLSRLPGTEEVNASVDKDGYSLLHRATMEGFGDVVEVLVEKQIIDANIQDHCGCTALHLAYAFGHDHIASLLKPVTDLSLTDEDGRTPEQCIPLPPVDPNPAPLIPHSTYPSVVTWTLHVPQPLAAKRFASSRLPSVVSWTLHPPRPWSQLPSVVTWTQRHVPRHPPRAQGQDTAVQSDGQATKSNGDLSAVWSARASVVTWNSHNASWREGGGARVT